MRTPALALLWQQWSRSRLATAAILVYVLVLTAAAHAPWGMEARGIIFASSSPLTLAVLCLLAIYTFPEADVLARHSGFPAWMLTLPVRTRTLVFWPMLHGAVAAALGWIVPAALILRPLGLPVPLAWPAALLAGVLACLQALLWTPFGLPYMRVIAALLLIPAFITLAVDAAVRGVSPMVVTTAGLALLGLAYAAAVAGLARARRGETPTGEWFTQPRWGLPRRKGWPTFPSPDRAQLWFEWRCGGAILPLILGVVAGLLSLPLFWVRDLTPLAAPAGPPLSDVEINFWLKLQQGVLFVPPLLAAAIGCGRRSYDTRRKELALHPFLATRPLASHACVFARWRCAAFSTVASWVLMLLVVTGWLLLPARDGDTTAPLLHLLTRDCPWQTHVTLALILAVLILWTWKNQVQGLYADLSGRRWLVYGAPLVVHSLLLIAWCAALQGVLLPRDPHSGLGGVSYWMEWLLGSALATKVVTAAAVLIAVRRRRLVPDPALLRCGAAWLATALALFGVLTWIAAVGAPSSPLAELVARFYLPVCSAAAPEGWRSPSALATLVVLFLPFNRLLAAVLSLAANRHG